MVKVLNGLGHLAYVYTEKEWIFSFLFFSFLLLDPITNKSTVTS